MRYTLALGGVLGAAMIVPLGALAQPPESVPPFGPSLLVLSMDAELPQGIDTLTAASIGPVEPMSATRSISAVPTAADELALVAESEPVPVEPVVGILSTTQPEAVQRVDDARPRVAALSPERPKDRVAARRSRDEGVAPRKVVIKLPLSPIIGAFN